MSSHPFVRVRPRVGSGQYTRRSHSMRLTHMMLPMTQDDGDLDSLVRKRIRALRVAQGWSLEELAARARLSQSSLSRIENGQRRLALDQLVTLARALDTSLDQLVETAADDVVASPAIDAAHGLMRWSDQGGSRRDRRPPAPGRRRPRAPRGCAPTPDGNGSSSCPAPRSCCWATGACGSRPTSRRSSRRCCRTRIGAEGRPCEVLGIFDRDARRGHQPDEGS